MPTCLEKAIALRDIVAFEAGVSLRPYQKNLSNIIIKLALILEGDEIAVLQARQSGKTEATADTFLTLCAFFPSILKKPLNIGIFAPAFSQATQVARLRLFKRYTATQAFLERFNLVMEIGKAHFSSLFILTDLESEISSRIRILSGAPQSNIKGETFDIVLIEQVEHMDSSKMLDAIFPMLSATGGLRILSGTPSLEITNDYYYHLMTDPTKQRPPHGTNPKGSYIFTVDWREAAKYAPKYHAYIMKEAERIGSDSDEFRATYNIEWIVLRNKFITREKLEDLGEYIINPDPEGIKPFYPVDFTTDYNQKSGLPRFIGWDPARENDRSVMTVVERDDKFHNHIIEWKSFQGLEWEPQLDEALDLILRHQPQVFLVESTGLGDPIPEFTRKWFRERKRKGDIKFYTVVEGYKYNSQTCDTIQKYIDAEMHMGRVHYPLDTSQRRERGHFISDYLGLERNYKGNYLHLDHPQRSGAHNDFCTSLEVAVWASLKMQFRPAVRVTDLF